MIPAVGRHRASGGDPYWANVIMLVNGGANVELSTGKAITLMAGAGSFTFSDPDFPDGAWVQDTSLGTGGRYVDFGATPASMPGDFTAEFEYKAHTKTDPFPVVFYTGSGNFIYYSDHHNNIGARAAYSLAVLGFPIFQNIVSYDTVYRCAIVRQGTTLYGFVNGVLVGTTTDTTVYSIVASCFLGAYSTGAYLNGLLGRVRITNGVARYTANYTPTTGNYPSHG